MLSAERAELRSEGQSALAIHLRECAACAAIGARLEGTTRSLAALLATQTPVERPRIRRVIGWTLVPIAAAAVAVFIVRGHRDSVLGPPEDARIADVVSVDVSPGQTATVIKTKDPKVTIVWLTQGGTE